MPGVLEDLTATLAAEADELRALLPLLEAQHAALLRADAPAVLDLVRQQGTITRRLLRLDEGRRALVDRLGSELGLGGEPITLSRIVRLRSGPTRALAAVGAELKTLLGRLSSLNARNAFLVERSVGYLQQLVNQVVAALAVIPAPTYAATGRAAAGTPAVRLVDRRA